MRDDRHRRFPSLDAARGHLRASVPRAIWIPLLIWFAAAEGYMRYLEFNLGVPRLAIPIRPSSVAIYGAAAIVGAYRAAVFHPQWDKSYRDWLSRTPWTAARPLPRGPIQLVWPDGLVVGALVLLGALAPDIEAPYTIGIYLFGYCAAAASLTLATRTFAPAYLAFFCLGLMARFWPVPWVCGAFGVLSYFIVYWGIWRSLKSFPWTPMTRADTPLDGRALKGGEAKSKLGWPYDRLLVEPTQSLDHRKLVAHSLVVCLLIAWWISCVFAHTQDPVEYLNGMRLFSYWIMFFGALTRLGTYISGYAPPISLAGRVAARRLIIPGYDATFLVFPLMFLAPETVTRVGEALGLSPMVYAPIIPPLVLFIALATPPGLRHWRLMGRHRMVAAIPEHNKDYVKVG